MGSSSKTTNSSQTQNTSQTPTNPDWVTSGLQQYTGQVNNAMNVDPTTRVPGLNTNLNSAFNGASTLGSSSAPLYGQASSILDNIGGATTTPVTSGTVNASSLLSNLGAYMNSNESAIVNPALAAYDQQSGQTTAQQAAQAAANNGFSNSGYAIQKGVTAGQLALGRGQLQSGLLQNEYNTATGLANEDADRTQAAETTNVNDALSAAQGNQTAQGNDLSRQLAAGGALGDLGTAEDANARANVTAQDTEGQNQRAIQGQMSNADISSLDQIGQLLGMGQYGMFTGSTGTGTASGTSTTTTNPSILDQIGQGLNAVSSVGKLAGAATPLAGLGSIVGLSDRRLKGDIAHVGNDRRGRRWYTFRYLGTSIRRLGVMAQEILSTDPGAVLVRPDGFFAVDYAKLGA